jgi:hypothetical protein
VIVVLALHVGPRAVPAAATAGSGAVMLILAESLQRAEPVPACLLSERWRDSVSDRLEREPDRIPGFLAAWRQALEP